MQNLATILDSEGKFEAAEQLLSDALRIQLLELGENHVEVAVTMNNLGVLCTHLGQLDRAEELLGFSMEIRKNVYGNDHHLTRCARQNLEYVQEKRKTMIALERDFSESSGWRGGERGRGGEGGEFHSTMSTIEEGDEKENDDYESDRDDDKRREKENERLRREGAMYERSSGEVLRDAPSTYPGIGGEGKDGDIGEKKEHHDAAVETAESMPTNEDHEGVVEETLSGWKDYQDSQKVVIDGVEHKEDVVVVRNDVFVDAPGDMSKAPL